MGLGSLFGAWQWKSQAPSPKSEALSKARFWTAMAHIFQSVGHQGTSVACVQDLHCP